MCAPLRALPQTAPSYSWLQGESTVSPLEQRVPPPAGHQRVPAARGSFAAWLRGLPLRPEGSAVRLFDGREKGSQAGVFAVVDIDVGSRDLQQRIDAVIRLRAEYLLAPGCGDRISFDFTSGHPARWSAWRAGRRPVVSGNEVAWVRRSAPDPSYSAFRRYLSSVFTYAGSHSLSRELEVVDDPSTVRAGDVFIEGGRTGARRRPAYLHTARTGGDPDALLRARILLGPVAVADDRRRRVRPVSGSLRRVRRDRGALDRPGAPAVRSAHAHERRLDRFRGADEFVIRSDRAMFGVDYPHFESIYPSTQAQVSVLIEQPTLTEREIRKILFGNAADVYGFDIAARQPHVDRVAGALGGALTP